MTPIDSHENDVIGFYTFRARPPTLVKDKKTREQLRLLFDNVPYPCLVDVKGRYPARIPDLSGFAAGQVGVRN